jgi:hypothetical protein
VAQEGGSVMADPAQTFTAVGRALYGDDFVAPLASRLGVERNTVGKWAGGKSRVPPGVWLELAALIQDRERNLPALRGHALSFAEMDQVVINRMELNLNRVPLGDLEFFKKLDHAFNQWVAENFDKGTRLIFEPERYIIALPRPLDGGTKQALKDKILQLARTVRQG